MKVLRMWMMFLVVMAPLVSLGEQQCKGVYQSETTNIYYDIEEGSQCKLVFKGYVQRAVCSQSENFLTFDYGSFMLRGTFSDDCNELTIKDRVYIRAVQMQ